MGSMQSLPRLLELKGNGIAMRCFADPADRDCGGPNNSIKNLACWAEIPAMNMEDNEYRPCQVLSDVLTAKEEVRWFQRCEVSHALRVWLRPLRNPAPDRSR